MHKSLGLIPREWEERGGKEERREEKREGRVSDMGRKSKGETKRKRTGCGVEERRM